MTAVLKESIRDIKRHKRSAVLLAAVISSASFLFFVFSSVIYNLGDAEDAWSKQIRVSVFMVENSAPDKLLEDVKSIKGVLDVKYIEPEQALQILKERFPNEDVAFSASSVPGYIEARVGIDDLEGVRDKMLLLEGVDDVTSSSSWYKSLKDLIYFAALFSIGIMVFVLGISLLLVFYAVKIGVMERREEIQLMRLCGATEWRIRAPYVVSGLVMGVFGASVGVGLQYLFGSAIEKNLSQFVSGWTSLTYSQVLLVYIASIFIGSFGNLMAFVRGADAD